MTAALQCFADKGIRGTTIRDIAAVAGVTEGALYRHFAGKDELAQSLFAECARLLYEHLAAAVRDLDSSRQRLCALSRAFLDFAASRPEAYEFVMARHHESVGAVPEDQPLPKEVFVDVMEAGMAAGEIRPMDANLAAAMMIGLLVRSIFFLQRGLIDSSDQAVAAQICGAVQRIYLTE